MPEQNKINGVTIIHGNPEKGFEPAIVRSKYTLNSGKKKRIKRLQDQTISAANEKYRVERQRALDKIAAERLEEERRISENKQAEQHRTDSKNHARLLIEQQKNDQTRKATEAATEEAKNLQEDLIRQLTADKYNKSKRIRDLDTLIAEATKHHSFWDDKSVKQQYNITVEKYRDDQDQLRKEVSDINRKLYRELAKTEVSLGGRKKSTKKRGKKSKKTRRNRRNK